MQNLGFWDISGVAFSRDNFIWIYDSTNYSIVKIDDAGNVIIRTNELYFGDFSNELLPRLCASGNEIFAYNSELIMQFDVFGQYKKKIDLKNSNVQIVISSIIYSFENTIGSESIKPSFRDTTVNLYTHELPIIDFFLTRENTLFVVDKNGLMKVVFN